jgi:hypothetical protein
MKENVEAVIKAKNLEIIGGFYKNNKTFVTKDELIRKGFDFSEWFSTSELKHHFDNEENIFEYKDFTCGVYYIKTRSKNLENPKQEARLFFQIIRPNYDRNEAELKRIIDLLRRRNQAAGSLWAYSHDSQMYDSNQAKKQKEKLDIVNSEIRNVLPHLKMLIDSLKHTREVFVDLQQRLEKEEAEDESWV